MDLRGDVGFVENVDVAWVGEGGSESVGRLMGGD